MEIEELEETTEKKPDEKVEKKKKKSKAKAEADARFNKKAYEQIAFILRRDADVNADTVRAHAETMGESVNAFLKRAVIAMMEHDKQQLSSKDKTETEE